MSTRPMLGALLQSAVSAIISRSKRMSRPRTALLEPLEQRQLLASISISNPSQPEGNSGTSPMTFDVTLSNPVGQTVTVNFATQDGTAVANEDYIPVSGTLTFAPNQTHAAVTVQIKGDTSYEPDEIFVVNLSGAANASIADGMGLGIIENDDSPDGSGGGGGGTTPVQAPYPGPDAAALPGTIQIENYDAGGEGLAYHDSDYGNQGGSYRGDNVDIDKVSTGGYYVGWTKAGEWMEYSVNVTTPGTYSAQFRVASGTAGGNFHLMLDGQSITSAIAVPNTGGWQNWTTLTVNNVSLASAGNHTLRLAFDSNGAGGFVGNFDSVTFGQATQPPPVTTTETSYNASPYNVGDTVQAENFNKGGEGVAYHDYEAANLGGQYRTSEAVDIQGTNDAGGGYAVGYTKAGEWLDYFVNASSSGTYNMDFRVASAGAGGTFHIEVDGAAVAGNMQVPNTGAWTTWQTITKTGVSLSAGLHNIRIKFDTAGASTFAGNFNWFKVYAPTTTPPPTTGGQTPFTSTPFAAGQTIQASDFDKGGEGVAYHDIEPANLGFQYRLTEGVDIQAIPNSNPKLYNVGWTRAGEWIEYTVNVPSAGTYNLETAVGSQGAGGTFHVEFNGVNKTGAVTVPNTGGWQTWQTLSRSVTLDAGVQVMRVCMDTAGPSGFIANFNWLRFSSSSQAASAQPLLVQAENYDQGGEGVSYHDNTPTNDFGAFRATEGVDVEACSDTGGGYDLGNVEAGEWVNYTINLATSSTYTLDARVASAGPGGTFHVEFDGKDLTGPMTIPDTTDWQKWQTVSKSGISLSAGQHVMRVVFDSASATTGWVGNLNWLKLS